jgi:hypothetical protein
MPPRRFVILRTVPEEYANYPHPECILGGWEALLSNEQKKLMKERKAKLDGKVIAGGTTGFHTLDADVQKMVKDKLNENEEWERVYGRLRFTTAPISTKGQWLKDRKTQVENMIATNFYPTHTPIYRT